MTPTDQPVPASPEGPEIAHCTRHEFFDADCGWCVTARDDLRRATRTFAPRSPEGPDEGLREALIAAMIDAAEKRGDDVAFYPAMADAVLPLLTAERERADRLARWPGSDLRDVGNWLVREADQRVHLFPQRRDGVDDLMRSLAADLFRAALSATDPGSSGERDTDEGLREQIARTLYEFQSKDAVHQEWDYWREHYLAAADAVLPLLTAERERADHDRWAHDENQRLLREARERTDRLAREVARLCDEAGGSPGTQHGLVSVRDLRAALSATDPEPAGIDGTVDPSMLRRSSATDPGSSRDPMRHRAADCPLCGAEIGGHRHPATDPGSSDGTH